MPFTNFGKSKLVGPLGGVPTVFPATWYIAWTDTNPGPGGVMTGEPAPGTGGYARSPVANDQTNWNGPQSGGGTIIEMTNAVDLEFAESTGDQGGASYVVGMDAASGGNAWWYYPVPGGAFPVDRAGITLIVEAGTVSLQLSDPPEPP